MFEDTPINKPATPPGNLPVEPEDMFAGLDEGGVKAPPPAMPKGPDALDAGKLKKVEPVMPAAPMLPVNDNTGQPGDFGPVDMAENAAPQDYNMRAPVVGKIVMVIVGVAVLGGLAYGGWYLYNKKFIAQGNNVNNVAIQTSSFKNPDETALPAPIAETTTAPVENIGATTVNTIITSTQTLVGVKNDSILFGQPVDTDKDGFDDVHEKLLGTNLKIADTDMDGLSDGEEVHVYKTDPLKVDTDKDGLSDGSEIKLWHADPLNSDSDGDGYADGSEVYNGYNPMGPGKLLSLPEGVTTSTLRQFVLPTVK